MIFEKTSTRTRCAFEVAIQDQGGKATYIYSDGTQMRKKESIKDTARVLGRFYDGLVYRGYGQNIVEELSEFSEIPTFNALTDESHPTQIIGDFMTIQEKFGELKGIKMAYIGDGRNNVANSLLIGAAKLGLDFRLVGPKQLFPNKNIIEKCNELNIISQGKLLLTENIQEGIQDCKVIYTDVWVSMGETASIWEERIRILSPYQVKSDFSKYLDKDFIFMHCLPAYHNLETDISLEIYEKYGIKEMEVTEDIFEGEHSVVFDQSENRLHSIKAILVATLGKN
ncbi:MAG: ornithine carbamoyltransferase [Fusobacteriaceae bacterium]